MSAKMSADLAQRLGAGMHAAQLRPAAGQRHIDALGGHLRGQRLLHQRLLARVEGVGQLALQRVGGLAVGRPLLERHLPDVAHQVGDRPLATEVLDAPRLQRLRIAGRLQAGQRCVSQLSQFFVHAVLVGCLFVEALQRRRARTRTA